MIHIYPIDDIKEHEMESTCFCNPVVSEEMNGELMCTHNSLDGREGLELANEILKGVDLFPIKENEIIKFTHKDTIFSARVISIQYEPIRYFVEDENGVFWHIDDESILR